MKWLKERCLPRRVFTSSLLCGIFATLIYSQGLKGLSGDNTGKLPGQINPTQPSGPIQAPALPTLKEGDPLPKDLFVELGKAINPATVSIYTTTLRQMPPQGRGLPRDPFFDMFEEFMNPGFGGVPMPPKQAQALGTGFIISSDGLIITNNHVVEAADQIKVNVQIDDKNEKSYEAQVIGTDKRTDLALIKIDPSQTLTVAQLGSSKDLQVGEWVAAFGTPLGLGHTMTKGIISAKNRAIGELNRFPFLQTDASINPGNSGGPLVNTRGLVIGVNTAIANGQGIGFAIPIDDAKPIIAQLQKTGSIKYGFLGVDLMDLTPQAAQYFGLNSLDGVLILQVVPNSPAAKAGIQSSDILLQFGDKKLTTSAELRNAVSDTPVGSKVPVVLLRQGKELKVTVSVGENPFQPQPRLQPKQSRKESKGQKDPLNIGFKMTEYSEHIRREFNINPQLGAHPVITEIERGSIASRAGLQVGDLILDVNQHEVKTCSEVSRRLRPGQNAMRVARLRGLAWIFFKTAE